ncbi:hypothetical protein [Bosea sp. F3-2]|uniref:hypothetical protein n=1 Tax=Bosea sp. F3-2 TaxID=2599640 RepID=UPI001654FA33|nr:hypothetical protein [Bosea sp. F3-2]
MVRYAGVGSTVTASAEEDSFSNETDLLTAPPDLRDLFGLLKAPSPETQLCEVC